MYVGIVSQLFLYDKMREIFPEKKRSVGPISMLCGESVFVALHEKLWSFGNTTSCNKLAPAKTDLGNKLAELFNPLKNLRRNSLK